MHERMASLAVLASAVIILGLTGCAEDGDNGLNGLQGPPGPPAPVPTSGLVGEISISSPPGGSFFDTGNRVTVTVTTRDSSGNPVDITPTLFSQARLHMYGPLDQSRTKTAVGLMGVSGDPNASSHDYVNLLDAAPPGTTLTIFGNVATFATNPVGTEDAGTYRATVWLVANGLGEESNRDFPFTEFQVKTATVETETVVGTQCARCHQGADTGQLYFHHTDPSGWAPYGNPDIDNGAIETCKSCHNQDGYANTRDSWDPALPRDPDPIIRRVHGIHMGAELRSPRNTIRMALASVTPDTPGGFDPTAAGDPTTTPVMLIHGTTSGAEARVHSSDGSTWFALGHVTGEFIIGETVEVMTVPNLTRWSYSRNWPANRLGTAVIAPSTIYSTTGSVDAAVAEGYFAHYTPVEFPPDVRNCTICHVDNAWMEKPSQYACAACHDNGWWGDAAATPEGFHDHPGGEIADIRNGVPGAEHDVSLCTPCHSETSAVPVSVSHVVPEFVQDDQHTPATQAHTVELALDPPPPAGGYIAGDAPRVYVTVRDSAGTPVDPATITEAGWMGMNLFVSGPRSALGGPVLTTSAKGKQASVTNGTAEPWDLSGAPTFILSVNGAAPITLTAAAINFANPAQATAAEVVSWLNSEPTFNTQVYASASSGKVNIRNKLGVVDSKMEILSSAVGTAMGWTVGMTLGISYYPSNDLRIRTDPWDADPNVSWNSPSSRIEYQLDDVAGLTPGTYSIYVNGYMTARPEGFDLLTFDVGTSTEGKHIAKNCSDCHGTKHMHLDAGGRHPVDFDTDYCKSCHDYRQDGPNTTVWASFGADPIIKKVHGIHRGKYLTYPENIYPNNPKWGGIVFPQDIRNCTKCHSSDTTGTWNTSPSRLACGACHDSDATEAHMLLQTYDPTPIYDAIMKTGGPWSGDESESCVVCHGEGSEFSAKKVHNISDPYVPPYPR